MYRNDKYKKWVKEQDCCNCRAPGPNDPHHGIALGLGGMGTKAPDSALMALCRRCHTTIHNTPEMWPQQWEWIARTLMKAIDTGVIK